MKPFAEILLSHQGRFNALPTYFEGNSRILKQTDHANLLLCKLKPTVFSIQTNGSVNVEGIDLVRTRLNALFSAHLYQHNIATSTLFTANNLILMRKESVAPIEVIVKAAFVGSPKHLYKQMDKTPTRFGDTLQANQPHAPYVRFDWRNPLPDSDQCLPLALAHYFIDTTQAESTTLKAFGVLRTLLRSVDLDLLDICFFMNAAGDVICGEISTDNSRIIYTGRDEKACELFASPDKHTILKRAETILHLLERQEKQL